MIRFSIDASTPGVVTPPDFSGTTTGTFSGALSHIAMSTFPVGPNLAATSGDIVHYTTVHFDTVSYTFDSTDDVTRPRSLASHSTVPRSRSTASCSLPDFLEPS